MACKVFEYDICIVQGSEENDVVSILKEDDGTAISLLNYTAVCRLQDSITGETVDTLTTENSRITIEEVNGFWQVTFKFPHAVTTLYDFSECVYQSELISETKPYRYLQGRVYLNREIIK